MLRRGLVESTIRGGIEVASRTDAGVSARANVLGITSPLPPAGLLRALNGIAPEIFFTALAPVEDSMRVRRPVHRTYRYFVQSAGARREIWEKAAHLFVGEVDVRSFGRSIPLAEPQWRSVDEARVLGEGDQTILEIRAPSFVWGMVRKIVAAIRAVDSGRLSFTQLRAAVRGQTRLTLPLAEPEGLMLWAVQYAFPWTHYWSGPNRRQRSYIDQTQRSFWTRERILEILSYSEDR